MYFYIKIHVRGKFGNHGNYIDFITSNCSIKTSQCSACSSDAADGDGVIHSLTLTVSVSECRLTEKVATLCILVQKSKWCGIM